MRTKSVVADGKPGVGLNFQPRAIAIIPFGGRVNGEFAIEIELGCALEGFEEHGFLDFDLMRVGGMLIVASAATLEVWAGWFPAIRRGGNNTDDLSTSKARL